MKKISILLLTLFIVYSCTDKLEDLNTDIKNPTSATANAFLSSAQKNMADYMSNINVNRNITRQWAQHTTSTTYNDETNYDITNRKVPDGIWRTIYRDVLKDLDESANVISEIRAITDSEKAVKQNMSAIVEVMTVYAYSLLVETFGDIPYTEALDIANVLPKYDDGETVYKDLIDRLSAAIESMDVNESSFDGGELIYDGNVEKWQKFANSLKLRMGLRIYDADNSFGGNAITEAATGVFESNADNALFKYQKSTPNTNQMWVDLVQSGRHDFVAGKTLVDNMNELNDPRRTIYFDLYDDEDGPIYKGGVIGASNGYYAHSHIGAMFHDPTLAQILIDYSSVEFMLAEAAELSLVGTPADAEAHYNAAILASFKYYGVAGVADADALAYIAQPGVAYTTATGNWKQKIGTQKWIALYNQGFEAWTEFRRLDYPALVAPSTAVDVAEGVVPRRYTYPIGEHTLNGDNYTSAASAIGGDKLSTKLFWDKF